MAREIEEMHEMEINVTTQKQHNIFMQKDIYREVERPRNMDMNMNKGLT